MVKIKGVSCYGQWREDSNCLVVGTLSNGWELDEIWCGDGWPHENPPKNWTEVVNHLLEWAERNGHEIEELQSC